MLSHFFFFFFFARELLSVTSNLLQLKRTPTAGRKLMPSTHGALTLLLLLRRKRRPGCQQTGSKVTEVKLVERFKVYFQRIFSESRGGMFENV